MTAPALSLQRNPNGIDSGGALPVEPGPTVSPVLSENQVDAEGERTRRQIADDILERHQHGLNARRERDLLSEKLLLHIDGSGDFQWADILDGAKVEIPRLISEYRKQENVLRVLVDNAVAHHTTMDLNYFAKTMPDRQSRDRGLMDTLWMNDLAQRQDLNGLFAEALYLAMPAGFCLVHGYWREDSWTDHHEPIAYGPASITPTAGMIDAFVGNPFGTVFDPAAKRNSIHWCSYERILPAELVRIWFGHIPGIETITGSTKLPSAATFQRLARQWLFGGLGVHGHGIMTNRSDDEELLTVICREVAPSFEGGKYANGRLQIIAVPGEVDLRRGERRSSGALLLADQPLPGKDYSFSVFYSHHRGNDVHGKPWIEDLDQIQVDLNIALSKRWEVINRMVDAPIVTPGGAIAEDLADLDGYAVLEIEPSMAAWRPQVMEWPQGILTALNSEVEEKRESLYRMGGYQAASRGESPGSRTPYRAILALQQADNTIHGPVNQRFRRSGCDFAKRCWSQFKFYGDVPWLLNIVGDEYAYLAESYVDSSKLSDSPPDYRLVNAFGSSPELRAQEVLELVAMRGADGQPFMTTQEARRQYPNQQVFDSAGDPTAVQKRRARTVATEMHRMAIELRRQSGMEERDPAHPWVQEAARQVFMQAEGRFPRLRDDMLQAHLDAYSEVTQDETADPIARLAVMMRQELYYQWQAMMAATPMPGGGGASPVAGATAAPGGLGRDARGVAAELEAGGQAGGTNLSETA